MNSKASLRERSRQAAKSKQEERHYQNIRVIVAPKRKYARLVFVPVKAELRENTLFKVFVDLKAYHRKRRETETLKVVKNTNSGVFSTKYIEMTVLKEDVDRKIKDVLDIIFRLEGRKKYPKRK